jgi:nickel/cobalt exporter
MRRFGRALPWAALSVLTVFVLLSAHPAWAQAHNPFGVGISEGGGHAGGLTGWIIQKQVLFERQLSATVRAARTDGSALWLLVGLSFAYGVFHAAGPGHGKAVMASYLFANERALRRGLVLSLLAALLQGLVAIVLVGLLALVLHATAQRMKDAASLVESLSYAGIALLGAWLVWQKGFRFIKALLATAPPAPIAASADGPVPTLRPFAGCGHDHATGLTCTPVGLAASPHVHGPDCGHFHAPDPATLGEGFSWREAILTVVAAGSRPCSGAILVLVFGLAQGMFMAGVAAVLAMSLGTAITTGAIASLAVLAKGLALRVSAPGSRRGTLLIRGLETVAAAIVLAAGLSLFLGYTAMGGA